MRKTDLNQAGSIQKWLGVLHQHEFVETIFFLEDFFFLMWTVFKGFIEFVTVLLLFYLLVFLAMRHMGS